MLTFKIPIDALDDGISNFLSTGTHYANIKCTRKMFSIILPPVGNRSFTAAIQMAPQFFTQYTCNYLHYTIISLEYFSDLMSDMNRRGFNSLTLSLSETPVFRVIIALEFHTYVDERRLFLAMLPTFESAEEEDVGEINCSYFVSIGIEDFKSFVTELGDGNEVGVVLRNSFIKFYVGRRVITLSTMTNECVIGGIGIAQQIQTSIRFYPLQFFNNIKSKRVWFFKSNNRGLMLTAPMGLYHRISAYFPERFKY